MKPRVVVIGAGIAGLSTAFAIQEKLGNAIELTVYADKFYDFTTSYGAAGISRSAVESPRDEVLSYYKWRKELEKCNLDLHRDLTISMQHISPEDVSILPREVADQYKTHFSNVTMLVESRIYLPWLRKQLEAKGAKLLERKIRDLKELRDEADHIIVCTGLGAYLLLDDKTISIRYPIRGQTIKVRAPWVKHFIIAVGSDNPCYVIPCQDFVVLGGIWQKGRWDVTIDAKDREYIWKATTEHIPSLARAEVLGEWAGLRPGRPRVRLEAEVKDLDGRNVGIVYNYGHAGRGVDLAWGCADDVGRAFASQTPTSRVMQSIEG